MKNTKVTAYAKTDVVTAYYRSKAKRIETYGTKGISYSYRHVSYWSDAHIGLSSSEIELMLEWN